MTPVNNKQHAINAGDLSILLKQPKILIFDEATSSLDSTTASHIAQTINLLKGKVSILFITHQMPEELVVDKIIKLNQEKE